MRIPGFAAEISLCATENHYYSENNESEGAGGVAAAFDLCSRCSHLTGCAKARCYCICNGGDWSPGHFGTHFPCGICF